MREITCCTEKDYHLGETAVHAGEFLPPYTFARPGKAPRGRMRSTNLGILRDSGSLGLPTAA